MRLMNRLGGVLDGNKAEVNVDESNEMIEHMVIGFNGV